MSKTDLHVIVYKLLRYVYECNKRGVIPDLVEAHNLVNVPESYFNQTTQEMTCNGFVRGSYLPGMTLTLKGEEFLTENSAMQKARDFLGAGFDVVLSELFR